MTVSLPVRRIAVIGAGPSGLAAVKYILAEKCFEKIDVFEKRGSVGGVWNYTPAAVKSGLVTPVPQVNPNALLDGPIWHPTGDNEETLQPTFVSPVYSTLVTNIPKDLMAYGDKSFPPECQVLPKYSTVRQYLEEYAKDVKDLIQFETEVLDVRSEGQTRNNWSVTTRNLRTRAELTESYDAVVVASGHFNVPYLPDIPGITEWNDSYPGIILHSKSYDSPEPFHDKKVIVVGSSASGLDIGGQISPVSKGQLLVSQRTEPNASLATEDKTYFPEIVEFLPPASHKRAVRFADGRIETDIDAIVFCTGYFYSFPFLSSLDPPVIGDGRRTLNTYQHLFYIYNPTLVFPVLPQRVIPFPLSENQAAIFSRVWSGRLSLPSTAEMKAWEDFTLAEKGDGTAFHLMHFPLDAEYINFLYNWATKAKPRQGLVNSGQGKQGNLWGGKERWMRQMFPEIRRKFIAKGEDCHNITSLAQLGYDYEDWKDTQEHGV
ncbi:putative flavin dependent monooxygenase [Aspergillus clavatus NRRL 1]|uniref:Flavin dependent monooxygenase, putative n=1 Tax=Aspergillus clavatus (strain ATCC 1007 / CBS 513.65 / DSM 816 / NCTC 3887 / NRRL 1 / QM 1276 / 107) TaxID=344612 RepID=A1C500_ASPCL|nr:flavin dependent monooxygenase, putative [Aspergillus clavatus NRRL 1]EAW14768.1 flavin dependent monooxygenase, putative [Aspergillus clavatus NRRL 1]